MGLVFLVTDLQRYFTSPDMDRSTSLDIEALKVRRSQPGGAHFIREGGRVGGDGGGVAVPRRVGGLAGGLPGVWMRRV